MLLQKKVFLIATFFLTILIVSAQVPTEFFEDSTVVTGNIAHPYFPTLAVQLGVSVLILFVSFLIAYAIFSARLESSLKRKLPPHKLMMRCIWFIPIITAGLILLVFGIYTVPTSAEGSMAMGMIFTFAIRNGVTLVLSIAMVALSMAMFINGFLSR